MQVKYNEILFLNSKKYDNKHTTCVGLYIFELKSLFLGVAQKSIGYYDLLINFE